MKQIKIAFDLDGTLIHLMPVFERIIWEKYKAKVPSIRSFKIFTEPELPYETIKDCFSEAFKCVDEIEIVPGVRKLFRKLFELSDERDKIKIVTARPLDSANDTYALCKRICKDVEWEVVIVEDSDNKKKHLNNYLHFVDDRRKTALDLVHHGKIVWMPIKPYNQPLPDNYPEGLIQINSLEDLIPWANIFIHSI